MPVTAKTTPQCFVASEWRPLARGSLRGWCTLTLPSGLIIRDVSLHIEANGERWCGMPSRKFAKTDGTDGYVNLIDFEDREARDDFKQHALAAINTLLNARQQPTTAATRKPSAAPAGRRRQASDDEVDFDDLEGLTL